MITPKRVNEAIDKGWRLREAGPPGVWGLVPPEVIEPDLGFTVEGINTFQLMVPAEAIDTWLKARVVHTPDEKLRASKKAEVQAWFHAEWDGYLSECDDVEDYATDIIVSDASVDFKMPEETETLRAWLKEVKKERNV